MGSILPRNRYTSWQKPSDNAARFQWNHEIMNLILVGMWNEIRQEKTRYEKYLPEGNHEARIDASNNDTDKNGVKDEQNNKLTEDDKELEWFLKIQIEVMDHCSLLQLVPRENCPERG